MIKVEKKEQIEKIIHLFCDIRFFMGKSVLEGMMGEAYVDNIMNPKLAILLVRKYCFMSGEIIDNDLRKLVDNNLKDRIIIPNDNIKKSLERIYEGDITKEERYSIKKNPKFNLIELQKYAEDIPKEYSLKLIDKELALKIKKEKYMSITDDYERFGVGYCCLYHNEIVGVASSNIIYKDGIEVNIKVSEEHRRKGIATMLASNLILKCIEEKKKVSWDAANMNSVKLANKLGFKYDSKYNIYTFEK